MKKLNKIWGIGLMAILLSLISPHKSMAQEGGYISDQQFYDELQPYGTWVSDPDYGNVWVPNAEEGFRPYATRGHWVLTDDGNVWVSDYRWGWAPFHYGRWRYDDYYGWEWIPGHQWAPAWVSWRHGGGYYGWAPLTPGVNISISIGIGGGAGNIPDNYWVCAPQAYITRPNIYNYYVPHTRSVTIIHNTTIINNTYVNNNVTYVRGPRVEEIRQVTHRNVTVYQVNNVNRPGNININNHTINIYRPAVQTSANARPTRVVDGAAYRQQNPNASIANRNNNRAGFNQANAAKLAMVARNNKPDNRVVRVNPANNRQPANNPATQPVNKPTQPNLPQRAANRPAQNNNRTTQPAITKTNTLQQGQQQIQNEAAHKRQSALQHQQQTQQQVQSQEAQKKQELNQQTQQHRQQLDQQRQQVQQQAQQKQQQLQQQNQQRQQQLDQQRQQAQQQVQQKQQQLQQQNQQRQQQLDQQRQQAQQQAQQKQQQLQQQRQQAQQRQNQQRQQQPQQKKPDDRPAQR